MKKLASQVGGEMMDYSMNDVEEDNYIFGKCKVKSRPCPSSIYLNGKRQTDK